MTTASEKSTLTNRRTREDRRKMGDHVNRNGETPFSNVQQTNLSLKCEMGQETPLVSPRVDEAKGKIENEIISRANEA